MNLYISIHFNVGNIYFQVIINLSIYSWSHLKYSNNKKQKKKTRIGKTTTEKDDKYHPP